MEQTEIFNLLTKASQAGLSKEARQILRRLQSALDEQAVTEVHNDLYGALVGELFLLVLRNRPKALPTFYPLFGLLCGDAPIAKSGRQNAPRIKWNLVG